MLWVHRALQAKAEVLLEADGVEIVDSVGEQDEESQDGVVASSGVDGAEKEEEEKGPVEALADPRLTDEARDAGAGGQAGVGGRAAADKAVDPDAVLRDAVDEVHAEAAIERGACAELEVAEEMRGEKAGITLAESRNQSQRRSMTR